MRLASRQLRTLAGRNEERMAGFTTSLLDVIRMASSAIEWYPQVSVGPVAELAVLGYAADDVATLMSALLDNATRYSPGMVTVSCHLLEQGGVMFRIEDTGIGIGPGPGREAERRPGRPGSRCHESTGRHTGFPVVHRIARKHSIGVRFASRRPPGTGTVAMVTLPPQLLCAIPAHDAARPPSPSRSVATAATGSRSARASGPPGAGRIRAGAAHAGRSALVASPDTDREQPGRSEPRCRRGYRPRLRRRPLPTEPVSPDGARRRRRRAVIARPSRATPVSPASPEAVPPSGVAGAGPAEIVLRRELPRRGAGPAARLTSRGRPSLPSTSTSRSPPRRSPSPSRRRPGGPSPTTSARSRRASRRPSPPAASPAASSARCLTVP